MIVLKIALVLVKTYVLVGKKGISKLSRWVAQKYTAFEKSNPDIAVNVLFSNKKYIYIQFAGLSVT